MQLYYNSSEARKYTTSSRIIQIQRELAERAVELLALPPDRPAFLLDIGCGSGLSGGVCTRAVAVSLARSAPLTVWRCRIVERVGARVGRV